MEESKSQKDAKIDFPKFITPLSWIVVLMATIKDVDDFYSYSTSKSIVILIVGAGAFLVFLRVFVKNKPLASKRAIISRREKC